MYLKKIQIRDFRNIRSAELELADTFNIITGDNGAGKTSLLEAVSFLARGKSFKTTNSASLIHAGKSDFLILATGNRNEKLGLRRTINDTQVRLNGQAVNRLSDLVKLMPLLVITPNSHELIERGPDQRRQFIDWGLFHVEQSYAKEMQLYRKALRQRNAVIRSDFDSVVYWEKGLATHGECVDRYRQAFIQQLEPLFQDTLRHFEGITDLSLSYEPGWNKEKGLLEHLASRRESDRKSGSTSVGPHRADLALKIGKTPARERLSRGQQKLVVISLIVAQARLLGGEGSMPTILVDDLPAELDLDHQKTLLDLLANIPSQKIITSIDSGPSRFVSDARMFHVEHGQVSLIRK
ncbi:MAG: DNA replication/repair protein RecF [Gammaproteobacteria bacterium]|jgi:DNA replication and repair protein RecF